MCTYDVGIIGAGPCGIACALHAAQRELSVALIECGNDYTKRYCAADDRKECNNCNICNVISGFGGCVHYGDSAKLSYYPSGKELYNKLQKDYDRIRESACVLWGVDGDNGFISNQLDSVKFGFDIKKYPVRVTNSDEIKNRIRWFREKLNSVNVTYINCEMIDYNSDIDEFRVFLNDQTSFTCRKLVLAIGRRGMKWLQNNAQSKGLQLEHPLSTIGFRFEMPKKYLCKLGDLHPDFKARTERNGIKYKTFCYCGGVNGGRLKFANYGRYTLLDGHILTDTDTESEFGNFALLRQLVKPMDQQIDYREFIENVLIEYEQVSNGRPIYQSYIDFKKGIDSTLSTVISSPCVKLGPVYSLFKGDLNEYCAVAESIFSYLADISNASLDEIISNINVVGVELEGLWDKIHTDDFFMTNQSGLYIGGDCGGETQGILQATMMGIRISEGL